MKNTKMDENLKESLSAVMDGVAGELELERVLSRLHQEDVRQSAKNYRLMGDVLRNEHNLFIHMDISEGVAARINSEKKAKKPFQFVHSSLGKMAVAASVTIAVITGIRVWNSDPEKMSAVQDGTIASQSMLSSPMLEHTQEYGARGILAGLHTEQPSLTPGELNMAKSMASMQTLERFKAYSLDHAELMAAQNMHGMLSLVRAAGFQSK